MTTQQIIWGQINPSPSGGGGGGTPTGRLTLTSGVPVTTSDVIGATNVYYTPYVGNTIQLWDGANWTSYTFTEQTLALGTLGAALPHDVFGFQNSGSLNIEKLAWTDASNRATAVTLQDGRYCKSGDKTRLYLGTFYTTSTTTTEDSAGGVTTQVGAKRYLWNMYNRVPRTAIIIDTTDSWSYSSTTIRPANATLANRIEFVVGLGFDAVEAKVLSSVYMFVNTFGGHIGVGFDNSGAFSTPALIPNFYNNNISGVVANGSTFFETIPAPGYHFVQWCETGADGTFTFLGDNGGDGTQSGLQAIIQA